MKRTTGLLCMALWLAGCNGGQVDNGPGGDQAELSLGASFIAARAAQGAKISPVPVDTRGKSRADIERINYGSYIVNGLSDCASCHTGGPGFLDGGVPFPLDGAGHVVFTRNLTPDPTTGLPLTEAQFIETMRTGRDFHAGATQILLVMPWLTMRWMSDGDLKAIYAYLRAIPPANSPTPPDNKAGLPLPASIPFPGFFYDDGDEKRFLPNSDRLQANILRGLAIQPLDEPHGVYGDALLKFARGSYIVNAISACNDCHTNPDRISPDGKRTKINTSDYLSGGRLFPVPPPLQAFLHQNRVLSADLTGSTHGFFHEPGTSFDRFHQVIDTGTHADENPPRALGFPMPWQMYRLMLEDDLNSIFTYMTRITPRRGAADKEVQDYARWCGSNADCHAGETCSVSADPNIGNECVGGACKSDLDCGACQTCNAGACRAPASNSACLANGI